MGNIQLRGVLLVLLMPVFVFAQELVVPASTETEATYLNQVIDADESRPPDRVYVLERDGIYFVDGTIFNEGYVLRITAEAGDDQRPVVYGVNNVETGANTDVMFEMGEDLWLQGLIIVGYPEPLRAAGQPINDPARIIRSRAPGFSLTIDHCIVTQSRGEHIRLEQAVAATRITNSVFANQGDLAQSNLGAGKAIDYRNTSCDSAIFINNTFVNFHDRIVRHRASVAAIDYFLFDHNTVINSLGYHGTLALGEVGSQAIITNNLFVDTFIAGADTDAVRQSEFEEPGELDPRNGLGRMAWVLTEPNEVTEWTVGGNYYSVSPEVQAFYDAHAAEGVLGEGPPLTYHINSRLGADSVNAFIKEDITLTNRPESMVNMAEWYRDPAGGNKTKNTPCECWDPETDDFDRRPWEYFADTLDATYSQSAAAFTGGLDGLPAGDLNWWQGVVSVDDPIAGIVHDFRLEQNYPNPFNPTTNISYSLSENGRVTLSVYNSLGQIITRLAHNKQQGAGHYTVTWDGRDATGKMVPTALYFYRLEVDGNAVLTRKMLLLK